MDELYPHREAAEPNDYDVDSKGRPVTVAPSAIHSGGTRGGGTRPLKGGYWFVRPRYREEVAEAIHRDVEKLERTRIERHEEVLELAQQAPMRAPRPPPRQDSPLHMVHQGGPRPPMGYDPPRSLGGSYGRSSGPNARYPPPR